MKSIANSRVFIAHSLPPDCITFLEKKGCHLTIGRDATHPYTAHELAKKVRGFDAVISFLTDRVDEAVLKAGRPTLKIVANYAVGYDNIDGVAARKYGITVTNTPIQELSAAVADHAFALLLSLSRHIVPANAFVRAGRYKGWDPSLFLGASLQGSTLGLVGLGRIGKEMAQRAKGFSMKVVYTDMIRDREFEKKSGIGYVPFGKLLRISDIISLHVPLTSSTSHLISVSSLKKMKKGALLINTARGKVVDERVVIEAVERKKLGGYATDVFECEPHVACTKAFEKRVQKLPNVLMTPHIASATIHAREAMAWAAVHAVADVLSGRKSPFEV